MKLSTKAEKILTQITGKSTKLGDLRTMAKDIKKDQQLAMELWSSEQFFARQLAILIMDKKLLSEEVVDKLVNDIMQHSVNEKLQLIDWLMANQLTKDKRTIEMIEFWKNSPNSLKRRIYWYYQGRLRWMGQIQPNSGELLMVIESQIEKEEEEVQWAMNFTTGWIGVYENKYRNRCIALGKKQVCTKEKWFQKVVLLNICPNLLLLKAKKEIYDTCNH